MTASRRTPATRRPPPAGAAAQEPPPVGAVVQAARRLARREAVKAAGVSLMPIVGVDLLVNARLLGGTIRRINEAFGLSAEQIERLPTPLRTRADEAIRQVGGYLIGRVVTQAALATAVRTLGLRLTVQQAAKLAPIAGMAASAALSGWLFKRLCDRHIEQCRQVREALPVELLALSPLDADALRGD
jgi:hypothetical protein